MGHFNKWLLVPAIIGVPLQIYILAINDFSNPSQVGMTRNLVSCLSKRWTDRSLSQFLSSSGRWLCLSTGSEKRSLRRWSGVWLATKMRNRVDQVNHYTTTPHTICSFSVTIITSLDWLLIVCCGRVQRRTPQVCNQRKRNSTLPCSQAKESNCGILHRD